MSRFDVTISVIEMKFAARMESILQVSFDETNFMVGIFRNVHAESFPIGFASDFQENLRRWC